MGSALAKGGGNQRAKLLDKWRGGDDCQVQIDEIEYNKKLVGMKRKAESSLLGEQKKLVKVEAELQEEKKVHSLEISMKELTQANKRLSEDIVRVKQCQPETSRRHSSRKSWSQYSRQHRSAKPKAIGRGSKVALSSIFSKVNHS